MNAALARNYQVALIEPVKNHPGANTSDAYRYLVKSALKNKLQPSEVSIEGVPRVSVFFPPTLAAQIHEIVESTGKSFQQVVAGLADAEHDRIQAELSVPTLISGTLPFRARPEQITFYHGITAGLDAGKIVIAEASTGVGKGRALVAAAIRCIQEQGSKPVIIAAPTVVVMNQLWGELRELRYGEDNYGRSISATILPGSTEFADDIKLKDWLDDEELSSQDPAVAQWIRAGGIHEKDDALKQVAEEQGIPLRWLMSDLDDLAENIPLDDFVLRTDSTDTTKNSESRQQLQALRQLATRKKINDENKETHVGADLIFCTHAMLALGQKTKWNLLPKPKILFVDEAHLLEESLSRINSHTLSLFSLSYKLRRYCRIHGLKKTSKAGIGASVARDLMQYCMSISHNDLRMKLNDYPVHHQEVRQRLIELSELCSSRTFTQDPTIKEIGKNLKNMVYEINSTQSSYSIHLQYSPDRRFPSISVGKNDVAMEAGSIWKVVDAAVLASATMYITDAYGEQKCDYVVRNLAIPNQRLAYPYPVTSEYLLTLPQLYIPKPERYAALSRPEIVERSDEANKRWYANLSEVIAENARTAVGGTLVLANSYDQIDGIMDQLCLNYPDVFDRSIKHVRNRKFSVTKDLFMQFHAEGKRPILIALGPAWTGLNLTLEQENVPAHEDTLLTDLVIVCSPIGLNRSTVMLHRIEKTFATAIAKETLLILKQGLGRLIRRNGVKNRRIWILDARIWSDSWMPAYTAAAKRLLGMYKNISQF